MATATAFTSTRSKAIEDKAVTGGSVDVSGNLTLVRNDGTTIAAGNLLGPKGDKGDAGLNAAPGSVAPTPNTTPIRTSDSRVKTAPPTENDDASTKLYVDNLVNPLASKVYVDNLVKGQEIGNGVDLNIYTSGGVYIQSQTAEAATGVNYPIAQAGLLEVSATAGFVYQRYTPYGSYGVEFYIRTFYGGTWYPWRKWSADGGKQAGGFVTATTDSGGAAVITHGLGWTPTYVVATCHGTQTYFPSVTAMTATTFTLSINNKGATVLASGSIGISWFAGR